MKPTQGKYLFLALCLTATLTLAACGPKPASSEGASSSSSADSSQDQTEHTLQGTVNLLDEDLELLVLIADEGYYKFDTAGTDVSGLAPGDSVTVTYTGTPDPSGDLVTAVLVSVTKDTP